MVLYFLKSLTTVFSVLYLICNRKHFSCSSVFMSPAPCCLWIFLFHWSRLLGAQSADPWLQNTALSAVRQDTEHLFGRVPTVVSLGAASRKLETVCWIPDYISHFFWPYWIYPDRCVPSRAVQKEICSTGWLTGRLCGAYNWGLLHLFVFVLSFSCWKFVSFDSLFKEATLNLV